MIYQCKQLKVMCVNMKHKNIGKMIDDALRDSKFWFVAIATTVLTFLIYSNLNDGLFSRGYLKYLTVLSFFFGFPLNYILTRNALNSFLRTIIIVVLFPLLFGLLLILLYFYAGFTGQIT